MVTLRTLAEELDLSIGTVSLALNRSPRVNPATVRRVLELAEKRHYRPSNIGRALQSGKSRLIGCLFSSLLNSFFHELVEGIGRRAAASRYGLLTSWRSDSDLMEQVNLMLAHRVEGILFAGATPELPTIAAQLEANGMPTVFCSSHHHGNLPFVVTDDFAGGGMAAAFLLENGHRNILLQQYPLQARVVGGMTNLNDAGISPLLFRKAEELPEAIRQSGATSVIFQTDMEAIDGMYLLRKAGFRIPEEVSVIGYDNLPLAARPEFELTTIGQMRQELGSRSVDYLIRTSAGETLPRNNYLPPELIVRGTVKKIQS